MNRTDNEELNKAVEQLESTLEDCPFCGNNGEIDNTWSLCHWVQCVECGVKVDDPKGKGEEGTVEEHIKSAERARDAWNKRVER